MAGRPDPRGTGMWARGPRAICLVWDADMESEAAALAGSVVRPATRPLSETATHRD